MDYKVDLHTHSSCSDGKLKPEELVKRAKEKELFLMAITDHDTVEGVEAALIAGEALKLKVIPGIEISAVEGGVNIHILGLDIDYKNEKIQEVCQFNMKGREERNKSLLKLVERDFHMERECFEKEGSSFIGKMDIARGLVSAELAQSTEEVFNTIFEREEYRRLKKKKVSAKRAVEAVIDAGGIAVWAHPGSTRGIGVRNSYEFWEEAYSIAEKLKSYGLKGIEVICSKHDRKERIAALNIAEKLHLHITQGSDFHG